MTALSKIPPNKFFKGKDLSALFQKAQNTKVLRPTVTLVIKQEGAAQFLVQEKKSDRPMPHYDLLKGGIDKGESILEALYREAEEECLIGVADILGIKPLGYIVSRFTSSNKRRDGFRMGKLHFVHSVIVSAHYVPIVGVDQNVLRAFWTDEPLSYFTKAHGNTYMAKIIKAAQKQKKAD